MIGTVKIRLPLTFTGHIHLTEIIQVETRNRRDLDHKISTLTQPDQLGEVNSPGAPGFVQTLLFAKVSHHK